MYDMYMHGEDPGPWNSPSWVDWLIVAIAVVGIAATLYFAATVP